MAAAAPAKLYYFKGRGRSQQARWALAAANMAFTSVCLQSPEEFAALCESGKLTYQQVPMLECGPRCISQSMAIVRHAARVGNLYGSTIDEATRIDEILDGIMDARGAIVSYPFMDPQEACGRLFQSLQRFYPSFEALLAKNDVQPYAVGASLTIADVLLAELVQSTVEAFSATPSFGAGAASSVLQSFPKLRALHEHVLALPEMQEFLRSPNHMPFPSGETGKTYVKNVRTVLG